MDVGHMRLKGCPMVDNPDDRRKPPETGIARPVKKGFFARVGDAISERFLKNPVAWFLLALLVVVEYWNYEHQKQLDAVCDAIEIPDVLTDNPQTDLEKAQAICEERQESSDMPDE
jgi:hypothetical protein